MAPTREPARLRTNIAGELAGVEGFQVRHELGLIRRRICTDFLHMDAFFHSLAIVIQPRDVC